MNVKDTRFVAASEAASGWLNTVLLIANFGKVSNVDMAFQLLLPTNKEVQYNLQDSYNEHAPILKQLRDRFAALSDGPVRYPRVEEWKATFRHPGAMYPPVWSSAHEAAVGIARLALNLLAVPLTDITVADKQWSIASQVLADRWKALAITTDEVAALQERIRRERALFVAQSSSEGRRSDGEKLEPVVLLSNWREITAALGMNHSDQDKVKSLNDRYAGPIPRPAKGSQPIVQRAALLEWWNSLAAKQLELANQREGAKLSAEAQHNYGREGTAAPEIGGGVKKRRRKKT